MAWLLVLNGDTLRGIEESLQSLHRKVNKLMALVQVEQSVLDAFATELANIADAVQAIVDDPGNPLQDADVSGLTSAVTRLQGMLAAPETPVEEPPAG